MGKYLSVQRKSSDQTKPTRLRLARERINDARRAKLHSIYGPNWKIVMGKEA